MEIYGDENIIKKIEKHFDGKYSIEIDEYIDEY